MSFFFWPVKYLPVWTIITMLQFAIPLTMLMSSCIKNKKIRQMHGVAGGIIFFAVIVSLMDIASMKEREVYMKFALIFLACSVFK